MGLGGGEALDAVGGRCVGQVCVLLDVLRRQSHGALPLPVGGGVAHPQVAVVPDVLDDPCLPIRHAHLGVVPAGLDEVAPPDAESVRAFDGARVVDQPASRSVLADEGVQFAGLIVGRRGDRGSVDALGGDRGAQHVGVLVQHDQAERVQPVE